MSKIKDKNNIYVNGIVETQPMYWYTWNGIKDYIFTISVKRYSGTIDYIRICVAESVIKEKQIKIGEAYSIIGQVRTRNIRVVSENKKSILEVFVYPRQINKIDEFDDSMYINECEIEGTIVKKNFFKDRLFSKKLLYNFILASNRKCGEPSYLPCIAWNENAIELTKCEVGTTKLKFKGRFQSRSIMKKNSTVYEISITKLEILSK